MEQTQNKIPTLEQIQDALEEIIRKHPEFDLGVKLHYTNMWNDEGEPLFLANIGTVTNPMYIGGTMAQLDERIKTFYKHVRESINDLTDNNGIQKDTF